jgi:hypothetical protein
MLNMPVAMGCLDVQAASMQRATVAPANGSAPAHRLWHGAALAVLGGLMSAALQRPQLAYSQTHNFTKCFLILFPSFLHLSLTPSFPFHPCETTMAD